MRYRVRTHARLSLSLSLSLSLARLSRKARNEWRADGLSRLHGRITRAEKWEIRAINMYYS